jgi:hypothetical protein
VSHRLSRALITAVAAAVTTAIVLAVTDLYLSGHGHSTLSRPWLEWSAGGVSLSRADLVLLVVTVGAGIAGASRRHS